VEVESGLQLAGRWASRSTSSELLCATQLLDIHEALNSCRLPTMVLEDAEDDLPALEINLQMQVQVPECLMRKDLKKGSLGPSIIQENRIVSSAYDMELHRAFVGMENGEVIWWEVRQTSLSSHRELGNHAVRTCRCALCLYTPAATQARGRIDTPAMLLQGSVTALCCLHACAAISLPLVASGSADRRICLWFPSRGTYPDTATLVQTIHRHEGTVTALAAHGSMLVSGATDCTVRLWRPAQDRGALRYPQFEQVKLLHTMPSWVSSIALPQSGGPDDAHNTFFVSDSSANALRVAAELVDSSDPLRSALIQALQVLQSADSALIQAAAGDAERREHQCHVRSSGCILSCCKESSGMQMDRF
jgi:hypothetical protein